MEYHVTFPFILKTLNMNDQSSGELTKGKSIFQNRMLYQFGSNAIVWKDTHAKSLLSIATKDIKTQRGQAEYLQWKVSVGEHSQIVTTRAYKGRVGKVQHLDLNGVHVDFSVGAKRINIPFSIKLVDFELERYPGSMTPASYASDVILIDKEANLTLPYRIYMNNILDHKNYRFFQSSYDPDEKGTVLSVNHDPGTLPTYLGYLLLTIGMLWSLMIPNGRFRKALKNARQLQGVTLGIALAFFLALTPQNSHAASPVLEEKVLISLHLYDLEHTLNFGKLAVQDHQGRMKPMDTVAHDVIAKITGRSALYNLEPSQIFLGMIMQPELYQSIPMIKIGHKKIAVDIGLDADVKYAKFSDFFLMKDGTYKIFDAVTASSQKKPLEKSQYDKELLKIDERVNVAFMAYQGSLLRIYPRPNDANNQWMAPMNAIKEYSKAHGDTVKLSISAYFQMVAEGLQTGNWGNADLALKGIRMYQEKYGSAVMPSQTHIDMEIKYNQFGLFGKLVPIYLILGLLLLVFAFIHVLKPAFPMKWIMRGAWTVLIVWLCYAHYRLGNTLVYLRTCPLVKCL
ncbi:MAG: cytochrome c biogenesis protein ResB [Sulfurovum sp.]|nr:cytochrome c biogenesis protein ResB [Sulfurovum sp.]